MEQKKEWLFLGHNVDYWLELERQAQALNAERLIDEIAKLRAKVSFYESRVTEMAAFKRVTNKV